MTEMRVIHWSGFVPSLAGRLRMPDASLIPQTHLTDEVTCDACIEQMHAEGILGPGR